MIGSTQAFEIGIAVVHDTFNELVEDIVIVSSSKESRLRKDKDKMSNGPKRSPCPGYWYILWTTQLVPFNT